MTVHSTIFRKPIVEEISSKELVIMIFSQTFNIAMLSTSKVWICVMIRLILILLMWFL